MTKEEITLRIIDNLNNRNGFNDLLSNLDYDIINDIKVDISDIIENALPKWTNGDVIPNLNEDEDYKEFIVIKNEAVITGMVFSRRDGYFISNFDTSDCPRKIDVKLYIELPKKP